MEVNILTVGKIAVGILTQYLQDRANENVGGRNAEKGEIGFIAVRSNLNFKRLI
jgi:hypothetical protein